MYHEEMDLAEATVSMLAGFKLAGRDSLPPNIRRIFDDLRDVVENKLGGNIYGRLAGTLGLDMDPIMLRFVNEVRTAMYADPQFTLRCWQLVTMRKDFARSMPSGPVLRPLDYAPQVKPASEPPQRKHSGPGRTLLILAGVGVVLFCLCAIVTAVF